MDLQGYTDADGSTNEDRHTVSGYVFLIDEGPISWSVKTQEIIALSMTKAEYVAATHAAKEALWLCVKPSSSRSGTDESGNCENVRLSAACPSNEATIRSVVVAVA